MQLSVQGDTYQTRNLSKSYKAYGIKLVFTDSHPGHEGENTTTNEMSLAELNLGLLK